MYDFAWASKYVRQRNQDLLVFQFDICMQLLGASQDKLRPQDFIGFHSLQEETCCIFAHQLPVIDLDPVPWNQALKYVSFAVQMLGKSFKMMLDSYRVQGSGVHM